MSLINTKPLYTLASELGQALLLRHWTLSTAESCTGGWVSQAITSVSGSSLWFDRGFVTYSNASKTEMLQVSKETLDTEGAVSQATALAMASGALIHSAATISLAITGIAGPEGGSQDKPVGTVWFAFANKKGVTQAECQHFKGDRESVRFAATCHALKKSLEFVISF